MWITLAVGDPEVQIKVKIKKLFCISDIEISENLSPWDSEQHS